MGERCGLGPDFLDSILSGLLTAQATWIATRNAVALRRELLALTDRMRALDGVVSTETFFYLEMWKQLYDWGTRK